MGTSKGVMAYIDSTGRQQSIGVDVVGVYYGAAINSTEVSNHKYHTAYFNNVYFDNFTIELLLAPYATYKAVSQWLYQYALASVDPTISNTPAMTVVVHYNDPKIADFAGVGVLDSGGSHGDSVGMITYPMTLEFLGAANLLDSLSATFNKTTGSVPLKASNFYPSGNLASSPAQTVEVTLFNQFFSPTFVPSATF